MLLHDGEEYLCCSVRDGHHHSQCWRLAGIDHPEHPHIQCWRTPSMVFGLMPEQTLIDLNNNSWSSKHQWGVNFDDLPTANIPEIACMALFFPILASWEASPTGYCRTHQYINTTHCFRDSFDFSKKLPSRKPRDFLQFEFEHLHL